MSNLFFWCCMIVGWTIVLALIIKFICSNRDKDIE
jgi:hypothetical protein